MSEHREEHLELCAELVLGALDDAERRSLEAHLAEGCAACDAELSRLAQGAVVLARAAAPAAPRAGLRASVLAVVRGESGAAARRPEPAPAAVLPLPPRQRQAPATWAWAAAALLMAVAGFMFWRTAERLRTEVAALHEDLEVAARRLEDERRWSALIGAPDAKLVDLAITPEGAALMRARAFYDPASRRAILAFEHFAAPPGHDYQLWALRGGVPSSLGLIRADAAGSVVLRIEDAGDAATLGAFAVSLEPSGGSPLPSPTGPVVMVGKLGE